MSPALRRLSFAFTAVAVCTVAGRLSQPSAQARVPSVAAGEWPSYAGDLRNFHYSPLDEITAANFGRLELAWRFKTDALGPRPEYKLEGTPLMVNGVLYATAGTRRSVVALDAATGELLWAHSEREGARSAASPRQLSGRGLAYWTDGRGDERILYVTIGYRLVALDAKTGARIGGFGRDGRVDLKDGVVFGNDQPIDPVAGEIGLHAAPAVTRDGIVLVGSAFREGRTPRTHNNTKGSVRAFDVRTGRRLWTFNTIPRPGEFGNDTWLNDSWAVNGNTGVWNQIAVDEDLGLAYLPVETPSSDFYGGHRPGDNLFAESLVAVDYKTGRRRWHFQLVHHPLWNMDIATAPILADIAVDGRPIKAVTIQGKQAFMYVFDRVTGEPVWPIEERPVEQGRVPGERYSPTQPFPSRPPAYDVQGVTVDHLIDFTPALREEAIANLSAYALGGVFTPPVVSREGGPIAGFRSSGGTNWPGASFDPETHIAYVPSFISLLAFGLLPPPNRAFSDIDYVEGTVLTGVQYIAGPGEDAGADAPPGGGRGSASEPPSAGRGGASRAPVSAAPPARRASLNPQGLPFMKPPYGKITAIDLDRGEIVWSVAHGETPDGVRTNPALAGLTIPRTGQSGAIGALVTKTLVIAGDPLVTAPGGRPRGAMLRAYDKRTGREVGTVFMPAPQSGTPMTYRAGDRQYIVVAVSGGNYSGEYPGVSPALTVLLDGGFFLGRRRRTAQHLKEPRGAGERDDQHQPPQQGRHEGGVERGHGNRELPQHGPAIRHPVPGGVGDERRQDDRAHALGDGIAEEQVQRRDDHNQHRQLAELDADVEREERRQQVRPGELQRLPEREREAEAVHQAEAERHQPATLRVLDGDVLERHVHDRRGDQRFDERREPERARGHVVGRGDERNRVRDGERRNHRDQPAKPAERDDQAEEKQQMVGAAQDMFEPHLHEPPGGLVPLRIQAHQPGIAFVLERADRAVRQDVAQHGHHAQAQTSELRVNREPGIRRLDPVLEQGVESALVAVHVGVVGEGGARHARQRVVVGVERLVGGQRGAHAHDAGVFEPRAAFVQLHVVGQPERRGVVEERLNLVEVEDFGGPHRPVDVEHRGERHADEEVRHLPFGLEEDLNRDVGRNLVSRRRRGGTDHQDRGERRDQPTAGRSGNGLHGHVSGRSLSVPGLAGADKGRSRMGRAAAAATLFHNRGPRSIRAWRRILNRLRTALPRSRAACEGGGV